MRGVGQSMSTAGYVAALCAMLITVVQTGCISGTESIATDVPPGGWHKPVELRYANTDTLTVKHSTFTLRHSAEVSPRESGYRIEQISPSGKLSVDTVRVEIAPIATRTGRLHETATRLNHGVRFDETGDYRFTVTPLQNDILGVWSVAIEFE